MINAWVITFLVLIGIANLLLAIVVLNSYSSELDKATKIGFSYMVILLVLNTFVLYGGAKLW